MSKALRILETVCMVAVIVVLVVFLMQVRSNGAKCLSSPISWGTHVLEKNNHNDLLTCSCSIPFSANSLLFNKTGSYSIPNMIDRVEGLKLNVPNLSINYSG